MDETVNHIQDFQAKSPPGLVSHGEIIEAAYIRGNMGGLVVFKLHPGELEEHSHEQEHVGTVLEGGFEFIHGSEVTSVWAGDLYRIPPNVPHGIRCWEDALVVQARR